MTTAVTPSLMTTEELLAMPDDGVERWLIRGKLHEQRGEHAGAKPMTVRNRVRSRILIRVGKILDNWLDQQPEPRGEVLGGEAGVKLRRNPDSTVGVDVVYISSEVATRRLEDTSLIDGVPILAVEILSPNDVLEAINEKIDEYLVAGVALVWVINPHRRTVEIFHQGAEPVLVNVQQELFGQPELPGFRVRVEQLFE